MIWGVDPGKTGHIAGYQGGEFKRFFCHKTEWELEALVKQIKFLHNENDIWWIEKIRIFGKGTGHVEQLLRHHERILAAFYMAGVPYKEVTPTEWQSRLQLKSMGKEKDSAKKQRYQRFAQSRARNSSITQVQADAFCICIYGIAIWHEQQTMRQSGRLTSTGS